MEYCDLSGKKFKIPVMKELSELQQNSEAQFSELRNKNNEQKKLFTKEIEIIEKNQTQILELKDSMNEMKNATENLQL